MGSHRERLPSNPSGSQTPIVGCLNEFLKVHKRRAYFAKPLRGWRIARRALLNQPDGLPSGWWGSEGMCPSFVGLGRWPFRLAVNGQAQTKTRR